MSEVWLTAIWIASVFLFLASAFFSGSETAIMSVNRLRLKSLADKGDPPAKAVEKLRENPTRLLSGILLGNNFVNVMLASCATILAEPFWGEMAPVYVAPILTILLVVGGEALPKSLATQRSLDFSRFCVRPLGAFLWLIAPVNRALSWVIGVLTRPFRSRDGSGDDEKPVEAEDLLTFARLGHASGAIGRVTHDILHGLYEFSQSKAVDVMVPRHEIVSMPLSAGIGGFEEMVRSHRHTRIPVWDENEEDVIGVLHAKDLVLRGDEIRKSGDLRRFLHPVVFLPEQTRLGRVLRRMQEVKSEIVFVVDEYGALEGLVTLRDILEELVGDIGDEHDIGRGRRVDLIRPGVVIADATVNLRYLARKTGLVMAGEGARTLGGLLVAAAPGELECGSKVELAGKTFTALSMNGRFLRKVRIDWDPELERKRLEGEL